MLTIFNDPAGVTGKQRHAWDLALSMQANIERHLSGGAGCALYINGEAADPLHDARLDRPPHALDCVAVVRRPEGLDPITWAYIAMAALMVYSIVAARNMSGQDAVAKDSPNNKLTAQTNVARAYQAVPDVYGLRRVWPDLIQPSVVEYINHLKFVTEWMCISRGVGTITDVQYADSPISDIEGASYEVFSPEPANGYPEFGQTTLRDVYEVFDSDEVNGQELEYAKAYPIVTKPGTVTVASEGSAAFSITFVDGSVWDTLKALAPNGAAVVMMEYSIESVFSDVCTVAGYVVSGGNVTFSFIGTGPFPTLFLGAQVVSVTPNGAIITLIGPFTLRADAQQIWWNTIFQRGLRGTVKIKAEWWKIDGGGNEIAGTRQQTETSFTANTFTQRFFTTKVTPAAGLGRYRIQFWRATAQIGSDGADVAKLEEVYAVRFYPTRMLPGVTLIRVTTQATTAATGFSDRKFNLRWQRHVRTLTSNALSPSRNFARVMAHIWTLAGNDLAGLDAGAMAALNAQHGENSPLLRFDGSFDDADMSLGERLQYVANTARCTVWRDGTRWTLTREQRQTLVQLQLDYRNLARSGDSTISIAAHLPAAYDGVQVEYVNEDTQATKAYVNIDISSGAPVLGAVSANPKKMNLPACTTLAQAQNRAHLEARRMLYQRTHVQDTAFADAGIAGIGALVRWVDPNDFAGDDGLQAGEVLAISGNTLTTSEPLDWKGATSGRMVLTGIDGRYLGAPMTCTPAPDGSGRVALASVPDGVFTAGGDRQLGSRYAFAVGLTQAEVESAGLFVVNEIKPSGDGTVSVVLSNYDNRLFEADT
jgi:hypothetical protein